MECTGAVARWLEHRNFNPEDLNGLNTVLPSQVES